MTLKKNEIDYQLSKEENAALEKILGRKLPENFVLSLRLTEDGQTGRSVMLSSQNGGLKRDWTDGLAEVNIMNEVRPA